MIGILSLVGWISELLEKAGSLFYVGATDKLPPPLSKEEEGYYLIMASDGDMFARDKLIEHNLRLVVFLAKKYENTGVDLEDLVSIGTIGLMFLRKNKKVKTEVSFDESLSFDADGNELRLEDVLGTDANIVTKPLEDELNRNLMLEEINKLPKRDKDIIIMRYGLYGKKEKTQKEVAEILGISQSYISRIEKKVIKRLKNIVKC